MLNTLDEQELAEPIGPQINPPDSITRVVGRRGYRRNAVFRDCRPPLSDPRLRHRPYAFSRAYFEQGSEVLVLVDQLGAKREADKRSEELAFKRGWAQGAGHLYAPVVDGDLAELEAAVLAMSAGPVPEPAEDPPGDEPPTPDPEPSASARARRPGVQRPRVK